jgi:hypothetical protein
LLAYCFLSSYPVFRIFNCIFIPGTYAHYCLFFLSCLSSFAFTFVTEWSLDSYVDIEMSYGLNDRVPISGHSANFSLLNSIRFGPKRDEVTGEWRKLHNEESRDLYSSPNIIKIIKSRRMRWTGHGGEEERV